MAGTDVIGMLPWTICRVLYFLWKKVALKIESRIPGARDSVSTYHGPNLVCAEQSPRDSGVGPRNLILFLSLFTDLF